MGAAVELKPEAPSGKAEARWDQPVQVFPADGPPMSPYLHFWLQRSGRDGGAPPPGPTEEALREMIERSFGP